MQTNKNRSQQIYLQSVRLNATNQEHPVVQCDADVFFFIIGNALLLLLLSLPLLLLSQTRLLQKLVTGSGQYLLLLVKNKCTQFYIFIYQRMRSCHESVFVILRIIVKGLSLCSELYTFVPILVLFGFRYVKFMSADNQLIYFFQALTN